MPCLSPLVAEEDRMTSRAQTRKNRSVKQKKLCEKMILRVDSLRFGSSITIIRYIGDYNLLPITLLPSSIKYRIQQGSLPTHFSIGNATAKLIYFIHLF
jgi:hypothetical protein